jgi:hypothetical protein
MAIPILSTLAHVLASTDHETPQSSDAPEGHTADGDAIGVHRARPNSNTDRWPGITGHGARIAPQDTVVSGGRPARLYIAWHRCNRDGRDHAVTDEEFTRGRKEQSAGRYESVCGHVVLVGSMLLPPGSPCDRCRAYLNARATLRTTEQRLGPPTSHHKRGRWSRLLGHTKTPAVPSPRTAGRHGRAGVPVDTGSDPTAPVSAGRHALRGDR